jgi:glutamyl-Q tRNA(Asp) synthetase
VNEAIPPREKSEQTRVFRFAPTPNGLLHRGHALSALLNARAAAATGGRFLLRIEDYDLSRARREFEAAIFADLAWLGLSWEEPVLRQSTRLSAYADALDRLDRLGLLYPALMTRSAIAAFAAARPDWPRDPDGAPLYPGDERDWSSSRRRAAIGSGEPYALRLDTRRALEGLPQLRWCEVDPFGRAVSTEQVADLAAWGDVLLARKEVRASYHLSVVVDDAFQGVTDVVRGKDLAPSTAVHRLLQTLLGLPEPRYFHHRLILDADGTKLSKSRGAEALRSRRAAGESAEALIAGLGL